MNLEICNKYCNIEALQVYLCGQIEIKLVDKNHIDRYDLPCQHYKFDNKKKELNPKIRYEPLDNKHYYSSILFDGDKRTKWCKASKSCPYYTEHLIYDEN